MREGGEREREEVRKRKREKERRAKSKRERERESNLRKRMTWKTLFDWIGQSNSKLLS